MSCNHVTSFPWLLCILSVGILIATGVYSARVNSENAHIKSIFDLFNVNVDTAKKISDVLKWGTTLAWCLTVVAIGGTIVSVIITFMADARSASYRQGNKRAKPGCVSYSTSRVLVSIILVLSYLTCVVTVALIVLQALVLSALKATNVAANGAQDLLNDGLQAASGLSSTASTYLGTAKTEIQKVISTLASCNTTDPCQQAITQLNTLNGAIDTATKTLGSITGTGTCAAGCLDLSQLWFVEKTNNATATNQCICDSTILNTLEHESDQGFNASIGAAVAIIVALLLWLIFFSKVSMNVKGLSKDQAWAKALEKAEHETPPQPYRDDYSAQLPPQVPTYQHQHVKPMEVQGPAVVYQDDYNADSAQLPPPAHFYHHQPGKGSYYDANRAV